MGAIKQELLKEIGHNIEIIEKCYNGNIAEFMDEQICKIHDDLNNVFNEYITLIETLNTLNEESDVDLFDDIYNDMNVSIDFSDKWDEIDKIVYPEHWK